MSRFFREFKFLHFRRVPIYWHSSVCVGLVASALLTKSVMSGAVAFFAYLLLILAHEIGHAVAAQSLKIDVFSLHVSAVHGDLLCDEGVLVYKPQSPVVAFCRGLLQLDGFPQKQSCRVFA